MSYCEGNFVRQVLKIHLQVTISQSPMVNEATQQAKESSHKDTQHQKACYIKYEYKIQQY